MTADIETLCEVMHDAYEAAATRTGWETQQASRKPWAEVPEANKATMRAAVRALVRHLDLAAHDRAVKAEALRETAKVLQIDTWIDLFEGPMPEVIGNSQRVVDWLRERADEIEKGVDQ